MSIRLTILTVLIVQAFADEYDYICIDFEESLIKTKPGRQIYVDSFNVSKDFFSSKKKIFKPEHAACKYESTMPNCTFSTTLIEDNKIRVKLKNTTEGITASHCYKCDRKDRDKLDLFLFVNPQTQECIIRLSLTLPSESYSEMEEPPKSNYNPMNWSIFKI